MRKEKVEKKPAEELRVKKEPPSAIVVTKAKSFHKKRKGRGFSIDELKEVGLNPYKARKLGLPVDLRRRTKHKENVEALKKWLK